MTTRSASTTRGTASSASGPRARLSVITAIVTVVEKPTSTVAVRLAAATRVHPTSSAPIGSHGHARYSAANRPIQRNGDRDAADRRDGRESRPQPFEVQLEARDETDDRDGKTVGDLQVARHRLADDVADVRPAQQAEHQVAGDARQTEEFEEPADDGGGEERDAERQDGGAGGLVAEPHEPATRARS